MKHIQSLFSFFALAALVLPTALFFNAQRASANPNTTCALSWELAPAPSFPGKTASLDSVAHSAPDDVWAVGTLAGAQVEPLALHWDGSAWSQVAMPTLDATGLGMLAVTAISATDVWAVGSFEKPRYEWHDLLLHWNGADWSQVTIPDEWVYNLTDVSHADSNHIWAVGSVGQQGVLLFYNGVEWLNQSAQIASLGFKGLENVHVQGADNVYIIGRISEGDVPYAGIAHWNGTNWVLIAKAEIQESNAPGGDYTEYIIGLAVLGPNDIWTTLNRVGSSRIGPRVRVLRWHNGTWETIEAHNGKVESFNGAETNEVYTIVGYSGPFGVTEIDNPKLARYWDGTSWGEISFPVPRGKREPFSTVEIISATEAWVVGEAYNTPNKNQPYIAHGTSPCAVPPRPKLLTPSKNQIILRTDPTLKWEFTPGADSFEVIFKQVKTPSAPVIRATVQHAKFKPPALLTPGATYKWRVRACNNGGCGEWTKARTFTIAGTAP